MSKSWSQAQYRRRTPRDVADHAWGTKLRLTSPAAGNDPEAVVAATIGDETVFSLRSNDRNVVAQRHALAASYVETVISGIRQGPTALTQQQSVALSREIYQGFLAKFGAEPYPDATWSAIKGLNRAAREGRDLEWIDSLALEVTSEVAAVVAALGEGMTELINSHPPDSKCIDELLERRFGGFTASASEHWCAIDLEAKRQRYKCSASLRVASRWVLVRKRKGISDTRGA